MAKKVAGLVKLQLISGQATPNPPVGPSLAPYMINIPEFIKSFNGSNSRPTGVGGYDCCHLLRRSFVRF